MDDKYTPISLNSQVKQMLEKMKCFDASKMIPVYYPTFEHKDVNRQIHFEDTEIEPFLPDGYFEKTLEYQQKSLEVLHSSNENTANLYIMVELIKQSNDKQDELISLMAEVLSLAKAKSKEEADTLFKKIMSKINGTVDSVESMIKIVGWATTVYNMVLPLLS